MAPTPTKNARQSRPKAKTGCLTCKIRRVKCDESKPACQRCTKTGRKCDGYDLRAYFSQVTSRGLFLTPGMSMSIPGSAAEKRGFSYYLECTGSALSGYYDPSFWWQLVVQGATADPALRHGVVAMAALHEAYASRLEHSSGGIGQRFSIIQYTKAISLLRRSLAQGIQDPQTALMSCILFASFESIRGQFAAALVHLRSGLDILRYSTVKSTDSYITLNYIVQALIRLTIQAVLHLKATPKLEQKAFALKTKQFMKYSVYLDTFTVLEEARISFNYTMCSLVYVSLMFELEVPLSAQRDVVSVHKRFIEQLSTWSTAFEKYVRSNNLTLCDRDLHGTILLKIQHITARIMAYAIHSALEDPRPFDCMLSDREMYVPFVDDFARLVKLSSSLVAASKADFKSGKTSPLHFSADWGLVWPLHYTCMKCPDNAIRTAALDVLRQHRRKEGMWDSETIIILVQNTSVVVQGDEGTSGQFSKQGYETLATPTLPILFDHDGMGGKWSIAKAAKEQPLPAPPEKPPQYVRELLATVSGCVSLQSDVENFQKAVDYSWAQQNREIISAYIVRPRETHELKKTVAILKKEHERPNV